MKLGRRFLKYLSFGLLTIGLGAVMLSIGSGKLLGKEAKVKITMIGHSTLLFDFGGAKVLTDPCFSDTMGWPAELKGYRRKPLVQRIEQLPKIDVIVCTHRHPDHFDLPSLSLLDKNIPILVSDTWMADELAKLGFKQIIQVKAWDEKTTAGIRIVATPALEGAEGLTQVGYVLTGNGKTIYFGGDTMVFPEIDEIGKRFKIDIALLPINGVKISGRLVTMTPEQAADAAVRMKAKYAIPEHYDALFAAFPAYEVTGTAKKFVDAVKSKSKSITVKVLDPGESSEI